MTVALLTPRKAQSPLVTDEQREDRVMVAASTTRQRSVGEEVPGINAGILWRFDLGEPTLSLSEQIASRVAERILSEAHMPGQRILEQQLAAEFRVSRGPVREALRILEREGLVEIIPRRGAQVTSLSVTEVKNIFDIRASLLGLAARLTAERQDPQAIAALTTSIDRLVRAAHGRGPHTSYLQASYDATLLLAGSSGNERLKAMVSSLALQTFRYTRLGLSTPERRTQSLRNWQNLAKALQRGRQDEAELLARQLVTDSRDTAMTLLARQQKSG